MTQANNAEEYISDLRKKLALNPECGTTHYNLAVALIGLKQYEEAEKELYQALENSPSIAEAYVQLGGIALQRNDMEKCIYYNKMSVRARAGFSPGYGNLGFLYLQSGDVDEAITNLKKAIAFNSMFIQAYANLANAYLIKGLVDESIEASLKALKIEPLFAVSHNNLAIAYLEKEDYKKAAEHCDKAIQCGYEVAPEILKEINNNR
ncbi:MAG: tetratricopeptide repeat protein [Proteobacteria bacterium]|nr:tetratricopeptide repeat protein [Pseudomonadota bacterium]